MLPKVGGNLVLRIRLVGGLSMAQRTELTRDLVRLLWKARETAAGTPARATEAASPREDGRPKG
jgi:hypothetical protein